MEVGDILIERSQMQKVKYCMFSHIYGDKTKEVEEEKDKEKEEEKDKEKEEEKDDER